MSHAVLGQQETHDLAAGGSRTHRDCLVLDVGTEALGEHLDGRLKKGEKKRGLVNGRWDFRDGAFDTQTCWHAIESGHSGIRKLYPFRQQLFENTMWQCVSSEDDIILTCKKVPALIRL